MAVASLTTFGLLAGPVAPATHLPPGRLLGPAASISLSPVDVAASEEANLSACRPSRRAVPHRPGGERVVGAALGPYPCMYRTGHVSFEPTLAVTQKGWLLYRSISDPLSAAGVIRSKDGGRTWAVVSPVHGPSIVGDPYLGMDAGTGRIFSADIRTDLCTAVSWTDDGGDSWSTNPRVCGLLDHETIFAGPAVSSSTIGYPNIVYLCAVTGGIGTGSTAAGCMKSLNGGLTFGHTGGLPYPPREPGSPGCDGAHGHGVVGLDGTVYLPKGWCGKPYLAISRDEGLSWTRVRVARNGMAASEFPGVPSHEAGVAVDAGGNLYYVWVAQDEKPYLSVSTDGGDTWSRPMMVGPPGLDAASLPGIDVGSPGRVAMVYMARGKQAPDWHGYITMSIDALKRKPLFYSAAVNPPNDPLVRGSCGTIRCGSAGDFFDVVIGPEGTPWAAFVDACTGECATEFGKSDMPEGIVGRLEGGPRLRR